MKGLNEKQLVALAEGTLCLKAFRSFHFDGNKRKHLMFKKNEIYKIIEKLNDCWIVETEQQIKGIPYLDETLVELTSQDFEYVIQKEEVT